MGKTKEELFDRIDRKIEAEEASLIKLIQELVRIPSVLGNEKTLALHCLELLRDLGLETDIWEPDYETLRRHPAFAPNTTSFEGRPNVVGIYRGTGGGKSLLLDGHTDVVPPGPADRWEHDPWGGDHENGRIYGRGANDMKAGLAVSLAVVKWLAEMEIRLKGDLVLAFVVDEELGGNGTLSLIQRGYRADAGMLLEPMGMGNLIIGHRGSVTFRIEIQGQPVAMAKRGRGANAVHNAAVIIDAIRALSERRNESASHPLYAEYENPVPLYVSKVQGGYWVAANPLSCTLDGVMGWLPGESMEKAKKELSECIETTASKDPRYTGPPPKLSFPAHHMLPCLVDEREPIVAAAKRAAERFLGGDVRVKVSNSGSDLWLLKEHAGIPSVEFGTNPHNSHSPDEYVEISEIKAVAKIALSTIIDWCGTAG